MRFAIGILFAALFALSAMAQTSFNTVGSDDATAISGYDVVAFFTEKKAMLGSTSHSHVHAGAKWLFSTAEHLKQFQDNPTKYVPEWGGHCAWAVSESIISPKKLSGDFEIIDGKLYLFSFGNPERASAKDGFLYGRYSRYMRIKDGDKFWPAIKAQLEAGTMTQPNAAAYTRTKFEK